MRNEYRRVRLPPNFPECFCALCASVFSVFDLLFISVYLCSSVVSFSMYARRQTHLSFSRLESWRPCRESRSCHRRLAGRGRASASPIFALRNRAGGFSRAAVVSELCRRGGDFADATRNCCMRCRESSACSEAENSSPRGPRIIDLDILFYGDSVIRTQEDGNSASAHGQTPLRSGCRWPNSRPDLRHPVSRTRRSPNCSPPRRTTAPSGFGSRRKVRFVQIESEGTRLQKWNYRSEAASSVFFPALLVLIFRIPAISSSVMTYSSRLANIPVSRRPWRMADSWPARFSLRFRSAALASWRTRRIGVVSASVSISRSLTFSRKSWN